MVDALADARPLDAALALRVAPGGTRTGVAAPDSTSSASALLPNSEIDRCCAFGNAETMKA